MNILSLILFVIACNLDTLVIGFNYSAKKIDIKLGSNFIIALICGLGTYFSMILGRIFLSMINPKIGSLIGSTVIILIGLYNIVKYLIHSYKKKALSTLLDDNYDTNKTKNIEFSEAFILGFALCVNNVGVGISASIAGMSPLLCSILSFIFNIVFLKLGLTVGKNLFKNVTSSKAELISSLLLIILGIYEILF